jgi:hypothetical protein
MLDTCSRVDVQSGYGHESIKSPLLLLVIVKMLRVLSAAESKVY